MENQNPTSASNPAIDDALYYQKMYEETGEEKYKQYFETLTAALIVKEMARADIKKRRKISLQKKIRRAKRKNPQ